MNIMDYKEDIIRSRTGCVGSSDGAMLERIARDGAVAPTYSRRLAVIKGLAEPTDYKTRAMEYGDYIEQTVFRMLSESNSNYQSNPRWVSEEYSRDNVQLISHPDIVLLEDHDEHKILRIYEVKATKETVEETLKRYSAQLYIHYILGLEQAKKNMYYDMRVYLVHYQTDRNTFGEFDAGKLTIRRVKPEDCRFDLTSAMDILSERLKTFTWEQPEEVDVADLPAIVQSELTQLAFLMDEIKKREEKIAEFKEALYGYLCEHNIKSIKNDLVTITRVDPTTSRTFDSKAWLKDYEKADPEGAKQLKDQYTKEVKRSGYALIKTK